MICGLVSFWIGKITIHICKELHELPQLVSPPSFIPRKVTSWRENDPPLNTPELLKLGAAEKVWLST